MTQNNKVVIKKSISKKLFWRLYALTNLVLLATMLLENFSAVFLGTVLFRSVIFAIVVNVTLLIVNIIDKRQFFIFLAIFFMSICFLYSLAFIFFFFSMAMLG
ncbi:MAG: hypothetical protein QG603_238 [Patescibacteria group bacterium]|nr:hypothetical protein [Patescibacteria group bacterium]